MSVYLNHSLKSFINEFKNVYKRKPLNDLRYLRCDIETKDDIVMNLHLIRRNLGNTERDTFVNKKNLHKTNSTNNFIP